ncbi:hypothetical protein [Streptomyces sp. NPDC017524]|uniref:hypothetical protein n=1 Tax=unclassified Streptomyces TaxID=2593676 RepID=UPI00378DC7FB
MTKNAKIGAALVGGYLLGRTKKAKLALGFGMFLLGKKIDLDPRQLGRMLADSPVLGSLNDQVRKELVDATKTAATKAVTQRAGSLADSLQQRTQALGAGSGTDEEKPDEEDDETRTAAADDEEAEADRDEDTGGDQKRKRTSRKTTAASDSKPTSRNRASSGGSRSGSGGRSAPARKSGGTARKTAASGARKAKGGDDA